MLPHSWLPRSSDTLASHLACLEHQRSCDENYGKWFFALASAGRSDAFGKYTAMLGDIFANAPLLPEREGYAQSITLPLW